MKLKKKKQQTDLFVEEKQWLNACRREKNWAKKMNGCRK